MKYCDIRHGREIIEVLRGVQVKHKTRYPFPSQETILKLLAEKHGIEMSRRHLNRILRDMEDQEWIIRQRRLKPTPRGGRVITSTLYFLTQKAWKLLHQIYYRIKSLIPFTGVTSRSHNPSPSGHERYTYMEKKEQTGGKRLKTGLFVPGAGFIPYTGA
jgi:hypothetical protein